LHQILDITGGPAISLSFDSQTLEILYARGATAAKEDKPNKIKRLDALTFRWSELLTERHEASPKQQVLPKEEEEQEERSNKA